jgi:DNA anti-recombination protein RmuC
MSENANKEKAEIERIINKLREYGKQKEMLEESGKSLLKLAEGMRKYMKDSEHSKLAEIIATNMNSMLDMSKVFGQDIRFTVETMVQLYGYLHAQNERLEKRVEALETTLDKMREWK